MNTTSTLYALLEYALEENIEYVEDVSTVIIDIEREYQEDNFVEVTVDTLKHFEGDTGYGGEELPDMIAWTQNHVYYKHIYDGSECIRSKPRHPESIDFEETFGGDSGGQQ